MVSIFFSYSHADESLRNQLEKQLSILRRQGVVSTWHDRKILAGQDFSSSINKHLEDDDIILLLVSPDFLASDYCYDKEMAKAMVRHESGAAIVIPVILRPCDWQSAPFGKLLAVPTDGRPVTQWPDRDDAFLNIAVAIKKAAAQVVNQANYSNAASPDSFKSAHANAAHEQIRSSNLRITKKFTQRDKDNYRLETFEYISKYFENSLLELESRNKDIEATFKRADANRFTASIYRNGDAVARCTIFMGGILASKGIAYSATETELNNSFNEYLSIDADDQAMFSRGTGMSYIGYGNERTKLSQEGAAEFFWSIFIDPLQRGIAFD